MTPCIQPLGVELRSVCRLPLRRALTADLSDWFAGYIQNYSCTL
jgi:hypothetical protein